MSTALTATFSPLSSSSFLSLRPPPPPHLSTSLPLLKKKRKKDKVGVCRADFNGDAPFAAAIGACMLSSFLLPNDVVDSRDDDSSDSPLDSTDTRFAVMGIISFIPYFNWLIWVFAWLDSGKRRYAVYALVYLAPYLRSNMSLSTEESWLPIASIMFCIVHVQLEASIRNGDIQGFQLFSKVSEFLPSITKKKETDFMEHEELPMEERKESNLLSAEEKSRNEIWQQQVPMKPSKDYEHLPIVEEQEPPKEERKEESNLPSVEDKSIDEIEEGNLLFAEDISVDEIEESNLPSAEDKSIDEIEESNLPPAEDKSIDEIEESNLPTAGEISGNEIQPGEVPGKSFEHHEHLPSITNKKEIDYKLYQELPEKEKEEEMNLPSAEEKSGNDMQQQGFPKKSSERRDYSDW